MTQLSHIQNENHVTRVCLTTVVYISACLFLVGLGKRHVWGPGELGAVEVAKTMASSDDLCVSCPNDRSFLERTPFFYWIVAAIFRCGGESTFWARLPAALAAISTVTLLFAMARYQGYSNLQAVATGLVLATSYGYFRSGRECCPDMVVCLFTAAALLSFRQTCHWGSGRAGWYSVFVLSLSAAFLTGGRIGPVAVVASLAGWVLLQKPLRLRGSAVLLSGCILAFVPVGIWMWFGSPHSTGNWIHGVSRLPVAWLLVGNHAQHSGGFYHYGSRILIGSLPWSLLLPWTVTYRVRRLRSGAHRESVLFAFLWLIVSLVVQLVLADGRELHLLLTYPAAALLIGTCLAEVLEKESEQDFWFRVSSKTLALLMIAAPIGLGVAYWYREGSVLGMSMLMPALCLGLWAYGRASMGRWMHFYGIVVTSAMLLLLSYDRLVAVQLNQQAH